MPVARRGILRISVLCTVIVKSTRTFESLGGSVFPPARVTRWRRGGERSAECRGRGEWSMVTAVGSQQAARGHGAAQDSGDRQPTEISSDQTSLINIPRWRRCRRVLSAQSATFMTTDVVLKVTKYIYNFPVTMVSKTLLILLLCHWKNTSAGNKDKHKYLHSSR